MESEVSYNTPIYNDKPDCENPECIDGYIKECTYDEYGKLHFELVLCSCQR